MQKIKIITEGKMKRGPLKDLVDELRKRLGLYAKMKELVVDGLTAKLLEQLYRAGTILSGKTYHY